MVEADRSSAQVHRRGPCRAPRISRPLFRASATSSVAVVLALLVARSEAGDGQPSFRLAFDAPDFVRGEPGSVVEFPVTGELATIGLEPGASGAQGWSVSLSARGGFIVDITTAGTVAAPVDAEPPGLRDGGFEVSELASGGHGDCELLDGAVSACVLSFRLPITLDPGDSPHPIFVITTQTIVPVEARRAVTFFYVDGCRGRGMGVENNVTYEGNTYEPTWTDAETEVAPVDPFPEPVALVVSDRPIGLTDDTTVAIDPLELELVDRGDGPPGARIHVGIVSQLADRLSGVQSWSLSASVDGGIVPVDVTIAGTVAAPSDWDPPGLLQGGFFVAETIDPELPHPVTGEPQGHGVVAAVIVSFVSAIWLPKVGTAEVLRIDVESTTAPGQRARGELEWRDLLRGSGQPVENVATVEGASVSFRPRQGAVVTGVVPGDEEFARCDANGDGRLDLADTVFICNALFRGGPVIECADAGDCDDDGVVRLTDAVYAAEHRFLGGPPPPAPFPQCGLDPTGDGLGCARPGACP